MIANISHFLIKYFIITMFNFLAEELKKKWQYIRRTFRNAMKKVQEQRNINAKKTPLEQDVFIRCSFLYNEILKQYENKYYIDELPKVPSECSSMSEELEQFPSGSNINNLFITEDAVKDAVDLTMDDDEEEQHGKMFESANGIITNSNKAFCAIDNEFAAVLMYDSEDESTWLE